MSVEETILELLKVHNRVILPGFGAFLVAKDESDDKPYVLFNSFLSFNDGLLIDYLAEKSGIDSIAGTDTVAEYVFQLKAKLHEEKIYKFNSLGSFDFDENGSMRFRYNPNTGKIPPKGHAKPVSKAAATPKIEVKKEIEIAPAPPLKSEPLEKEELLTFDTSSTPANVIVEAVTNFSPAKELSDAKFELVDEKRVASISSSKDETPNIAPEVPLSEAGNGKKRLAVIIGFLLIVVIAALAYAFLIYLPKQHEEQARKVAMEKEAKRQTILKHQSDSIAVVKARELALADSIQLAEETVQKQMSGGYHIIVGAFSEEANADKLIVKIKAANFPMAQKIADKNRFLVSVEACVDAKVASKRLQIVSSSLSMEGWIYKSK